jgi:hypothetical protein
MRVICGGLGVLLFSGCLGSEALPAADTQSALDDGSYGDPVSGMETQGRYLLGASIDPLPAEPGRHFAVTTSGRDDEGAREVELIGDAKLVVAGTHVVPERIVLDGPLGGEVKLELSRRKGKVTFFHVARRLHAGDPWTALCDGAEAVPLAGTFTTSGLHEDTAGRISLSCLDGVSFKCIDWGYRPGPVREAAMDSPWQMHQACTRMARADYCADGTPHTREGTLIAIFDEVGVKHEPPAVFFGVQDWPPAAGRFFFEAAWLGDDHPPVCLSKLRWNALPKGGFCGERLPDPRQDVRVKFCEDYDDAGRISVDTGAHLFNASRYGELRLNRWRRGEDRVSSIDGFHAEARSTQSVPPYPDLGTYTYEGPDGFLLRSLPDEVPVPIVDVHLYARGTDDLVYAPASAEPWLEGYVRVGWRGMAFGTPTGGTVPLVLYQDLVTGDSVTTTAGAPSGDYVSRGPVAWIVSGDR